MLRGTGRLVEQFDAKPVEVRNLLREDSTRACSALLYANLN